MIEHDPQQFLKDYLSLPPDSPTSVSYEPTPAPPFNSWLGRSTSDRWRASGHGAKAETIHFFKQQTLPRLQLHMVTYEDQAGQLWDAMCQIAQDEQGYWHMLGCAGSPRPSVRHASRTYPWVYMVGANGQRWLWAGGYLTDKAPTVRLVRLISKDGQVIEDTVEHGLVLFQTDHPVQGPFRLEAYTDTGALLGVQTLFDYEQHERTDDIDASHT